MLLQVQQILLLALALPLAGHLPSHPQALLHPLVSPQVWDIPRTLDPMPSLIQCYLLSGSAFVFAAQGFACFGLFRDGKGEHRQQHCQYALLIAFETGILQIPVAEAHAKLFCL